jgi:hypothetical protein
MILKDDEKSLFIVIIISNQYSFFWRYKRFFMVLKLPKSVNSQLFLRPRLILSNIPVSIKYTNLTILLKNERDNTKERFKIYLCKLR